MHGDEQAGTSISIDADENKIIRPGVLQVEQEEPCSRLQDLAQSEVHWPVYTQNRSIQNQGL